VLQPATGTTFDDVPADYPLACWIEAFSREGITSGCTGTTYCPTGSVNRTSMAILLLRARKGAAHVPPTCATTIATYGLTQFTDVNCTTSPKYPNADWIYELVAEKITNGCTATTYCPTSTVTRQQMVLFLQRTFVPEAHCCTYWSPPCP
jgi:hypothetical protein